ncbi:MAG: hypothetical protein MSC31_16985 [Solirubrobacteraceae bacterium MAG38_C4-C5]|nr:hypothetical protein [Candidatus Siliceabacter maunaloa]
MGDTRVAGERLAFDDDVWGEEVDRLDPGGEPHASAVTARRAIERPGALVALRACDPEAEDGTRLAACVKVYVPLDVEASLAPYGFVFELEVIGGALTAWLIAYGERHPKQGRSVYERAHKRLHGRYPDQ